MKQALQQAAFGFLIVALTAALLWGANPCLAAQTAAGLPWNYTLIALQEMLISYVAPAAIGLALSGSIVLYTLGGHDKQAARLVGSGIGGCIALVIGYLFNYVLP